jgi:hypothetical protein
MSNWLKKNKEYNIKKLDEDIIIALPSVNKFLSTFSYYLINELEKKDLQFITDHPVMTERREVLLNDISQLAEDAAKMAIALTGAWPKKRRWWHIFSRY